MCWLRFISFMHFFFSVFLNWKESNPNKFLTYSLSSYYKQRIILCDGIIIKKNIFIFLITIILRILYLTFFVNTSKLFFCVFSLWPNLLFLNTQFTRSPSQLYSITYSIKNWIHNSICFPDGRWSFLAALTSAGLNATLLRISKRNFPKSQSC